MPALRNDAPLREVAIAVADALRRRGITAVLTGGACATIFSGGAHQSLDVGLVLAGRVNQRDVEAALAELGFRREGDRFAHSVLPFFVEFPRGPLAIGNDYAIEPVELVAGRARALSLSATDSCRDRLSAFYHWDDPGSLTTAVQIAVRNAVDLRKIRSWSEREGMREKYDEFLRALGRARRAAPSRQKRR